MIITEGKTLQQVSDEIAAALIKQGKRCMDSLDGCAYGDGEGNHCAVGWLLDPSSEDLSTLAGTVADLVGRDTDLGPNDAFIREHHDALGLIQRLHDNLHDRRDKANLLESKYRLNVRAWEPWVAAQVSW